MSRDQLIAQEAQHDANPAATQAEGHTYGLRADLHARILRMSPADAGSLAEMIQLYPGFMGAILAVAAEHMGNAAVQRAIVLVKSWKAQGRSGSLNQEEVHASTESVADSRPTKSHELVGMLHDPSEGTLDSEPATAPKPAAGPVPAWVASARAFNAAHAHLVEEFNELTDDNCRLDGAAELDVHAVAQWQNSHGLPADGKVGPHTVAAARKASANRADVAAAAPTADARPPV